MSGNDISTAETAESDKYLPATQQPYYRYYNKHTTTPKHQQQQQQQQQQQCVHHTPQQQQQSQNHNLAAVGAAAAKWQQQTGGNNLSGEFDEFHWQQNQSKQQQQHNNYTNSILAGGGVGSKIYITPADIPPPPPHPPNSLGNKRYNNATNSSGNSSNNNQTNIDRHHHQQQQQQQQQHQQPHCQPAQQPHVHHHHHLQHQPPLPVPLPPPHRCKCEHSIDVLRPTTPAHHKQQQQQQQQQHNRQQQQHESCDYDDEHSDLDSDMDCSHGGIGIGVGIGSALDGDIIIGADGRHHHQQHTPHHPPHHHQSQHSLYHYAAATTANSGQYLKNLQRNPMQLHGKLHGTMMAAYDSSGGGSDVDHNGRFKNLVYSKEKIRKIRIVLSILLAIFIVGLLATALVFIIGSDPLDNGNGSKPGDDALDFEDVITGRLYAKHFNGSWSTGSNIIYKENHNIVEFDVKTNRSTILVSNAKQYFLYEKSADGQLLLLTRNYKKNFRHSYVAEYDIYNISSGKTETLTIQNEPKFLNMVLWAPVGNGLIINYERNLYYKPTAFAQEIQLTSDLNPAISNGIPDWVYEEEVFSSNVATWFNPGGTQIAFIRFDDSPTHVINVPYYGEPGDLQYQYPFNHLIAYPKAGSSNPRVQLFTIDLERAASGSEFLTEIPVPSALNTETDYIISTVTWLSNTNVLSIWMNRIQNLAYLQVFDGLKRYEIHNIESKTGWVELFTPPVNNRDGTRIALMLSQPQAEGGDYVHLCLMSTTSANSKVEALTKGNYVVTSILHWDANSDIIFYKANTKQNSEVLHVYAIKAATDQTPQCLTCKLQISGGVEQSYFEAVFNNDHQVIITSTGPGIPMAVAYEWSYANNQVTLTKLITWENNDALRAHLKGIAMPTHEIHKIAIANGFEAKVLLQLPPNMDRSGKTKYPMLVDVYGGPSSYSVINKWSIDWGTYLSSNQSVIYAKIDGRGTGLRGDKLLHSIYLKLGTVEIADQINVTRKLQETLKFIDAEHTGIWGWSYGGYAAAMALANDDKKVFKCAASVAPVTDWAYYDSIYTERYMSLPKINEVGYAESRLSTRAQKLRDKKYMLVHGTLDDNVHYQQAMILAKNLERHDISFKQISYTDEDHGLANVRPHLFHSLDRFFGECFASNRLMMSAK